MYLLVRTVCECHNRALAASRENALLRCQKETAIWERVERGALQGVALVFRKVTEISN
jgi:hypothetical protein